MIGCASASCALAAKRARGVAEVPATRGSGDTIPIPSGHAVRKPPQAQALESPGSKTAASPAVRTVRVGITASVVIRGTAHYGFRRAKRRCRRQGRACRQAGRSTESRHRHGIPARHPTRLSEDDPSTLARAARHWRPAATSPLSTGPDHSGPCAKDAPDPSGTSWRIPPVAGTQRV